MSTPMTIGQAIQIAMDELAKARVIDPPDWWPLPTEPEPTSEREEYERAQMADTDHDTGPVDAAGTYLGHD